MSTTIRPRRQFRRKRRSPSVRPSSPFPGWRALSPEALSARINEIRRAAFVRILSSAEWNELDKMRNALQAQQKFAQAVRETWS
jgi:hypothetical protein